MDFSPYQQKERFANPNANYTDPLRVHADHSGGLALAKQDAKNVGVFINGVLAYKEKVDSAKSMEANNEYNRLMSEGTAELMQRKQEKALNIVDEYDKLQAKVLERVQKQYKSYIGYGDAAVAFNNYTTKDNATRRANMLKYQLAETDAFHETQFNNQIASCVNGVLDGGGSDEAIIGQAYRMSSLVDSRYANYGSEKINEQKRAIMGQLAGAALGLAVNMQDYSRMGEICARYSHFIEPNKLSSVLGVVNKRHKEARELVEHQRMMKDIGNAATVADVDRWVNTHLSQNPNSNGLPYIGSGMTFDAFIDAVGLQESNGDYEDEHDVTGAYGKYQILPENWPSWAQEAGLSPTAPQTPENQEKVARFKLKQYYERYGAEGALVAWYAGEANGERWANGEADAIGKDGHYSWDAKQGDGDEPSIREYVRQTLGRINSGGGRGIIQGEFPGTEDEWTGAVRAEGRMNNVPLMKQWDGKYSDVAFSKGTMGSSGCCPTSMAMVLSWRLGRYVSPAEIADYAMDKGIVDDAGVVGATFIPAVAERYGAKMRQTDDKEEVISLLKQGVPVVAGHDAGRFTDNGHFVVYAGIDANGRVLVNDPNGGVRNDDDATFTINELFNQESADYYVFEDVSSPINYAVNQPVSSSAVANSYSPAAIYGNTQRALFANLEQEERRKKARSYFNDQKGIENAVRSQYIKQGRLEIQDLFNHDVMDEGQYRNAVEKTWANSGYDNEVRIALETDVNSHLKAIQKAQAAEAKRAEAEARRSAGGGSRGDRSSNGNGGKAKSDPTLLYKLEQMFYDGYSKADIQELLLEGNYTAGDVKAAFKELDELYGDKPSKDEMKALRRDFADICYDTMGISTRKNDTNENGEPIPQDPQAKIMMTVVMNNVHDKIVAYRRDKHYDPTQAEIAQMVRDESALVSFNMPTEEESSFSPVNVVHDAVSYLFGEETANDWLGSEEKATEVLTPRLRDAGIMNTPYRNDRTGNWVVETKRGVFEVTDEQLQRILDGERIEKIVPMAYNPESDVE